MGLFDLPVEKLYTYEGKTPRPKDFDTYWDTALEEMKGLDPKVEKIPASFQHPAFDCYDLYFTGTKGARIYAKYMCPKDEKKKKKPAILLFHGYTGKSGQWTELCAWASAGFCVAFMDVRGQGGESIDVGGAMGNTHRGQIIRGLDNEDPHDLLFRDIFLDTALLAKIVGDFDEVDRDKMGAKGASQGGGLTLACAALADIKVAAPSCPFLSDYQRVWEMDLAENAYVELKEYFRNFDPRHERREEVFTKLGYIDVQHLAPRIKGKIQMYTGLMDQVCPPSTQFASYNKISGEKEVFFYPDFAHEGYPNQEDMVMTWFIKELQPDY